MSGSEEEEFLPDDAAADDDVVIAQEEITQSLKKMNKIVNNLMARADCVPFREPVDWKGLEVSIICIFYISVVLFIYINLTIFGRIFIANLSIPYLHLVN